jgi:hypothetical protein
MSDVPISVLRGRLRRATTKQVVVETCIEEPSACGDYRRLYEIVKRKSQEKNASGLYSDLRRILPSPESSGRRYREAFNEVAEKLEEDFIKKGFSVEEARVRSRLREFGNFLAPLPDTQEKRSKNFVAHLDYYGDGKPHPTDTVGYLDGSQEGSLG